MQQLNRSKLSGESEESYKKRVTAFYKSERALLKEQGNIKFRNDQPKDLAEIIYRLNILAQATYYVSNGSSHCDSQKSRTENDLFLLIRHYINPKIQFKFGSELLWDMLGAKTPAGSPRFFKTHFCNTINRHCYTAYSLSVKEDDIRLYLEEKGLNLKVKK